MPRAFWIAVFAVIIVLQTAVFFWQLALPDGKPLAVVTAAVCLVSDVVIAIAIRWANGQVVTLRDAP